MHSIESRLPALSNATNTFAVAQPGTSAHPTLSVPTPLNRHRRDTLDVITDELRNAQALVEESDSELAKQYALAQAFHDTSEPSENQDPRTIMVHNIPPYSTFGRAWKRFNDALKAEPFATFAKNNNINTQNFTWTPSSAALDFEVHATSGHFSKYTPGWEAASAEVAAAARALEPIPEYSFVHTGEDQAPLSLIGDFYGHSAYLSRRQRLTSIEDLLTQQSFPSLRPSNTNDLQSAHIIEQQRQTAETLVKDFSRPVDDLPPKPNDQTQSTLVDEADRELARQAASALLELRDETRPSGAPPPSRAIFLELPILSTLFQTFKAFNEEISSDAFLNFVEKNNLVVANLRVDPSTGNLLVRSPRGSSAPPKTFTLNDSSGWSAVAPTILALAKKLSAGTGALIPCFNVETATVKQVLSFYAEPPTDTSLQGVLKQSAALNRNGFTALTSTAVDERSVTVKQNQLTVKQQLDKETAPAKAPTAHTVRSPTAEIASRQFAGEPGLHSVVGRLLTDALKSASPGMDFDVNHIDFAQPDPDKPGQFKRTPLTDLALDYLTGDAAPDLPANSKLVDTRPDLLAHTGNTPDTPLPVDISAVQSALRALPGQLNQALATDVTNYWSQPAFSAPASGGISPFAGSHRTLISDLLRDNLRLTGLKQSGLDEQQRETLDLVVRYPNGSTRTRHTDNPEVTVFRLGRLSEPNQDSKESTSPNLLIQSHIADRTILLLCEPSGKVTPYDSYAAFNAAPGQQFNTLRKVDGNAFDSQAQTIITERLGDRIAPDPTHLNLGNLDQSKRKMPGWVAKATEAERFVLRELSLQLASITQRNKGRTYNSDIPDIRPFAEQAFDQLGAVNHPAKNLEVVFKVPVGGTSPGGVVSGSIHRERMSMTDALLRNLSGLPSRDVEVYLKPGHTRVPELEKDGELQKLIQNVDVGKHYPELLKRELLEDPGKKAERQSLFAQQVPVELQIKALELSVKKQSGFDTTGFRYVQAAVNPEPGAKTVDGKEIVVRPLAFIAGPGATPDVVDNMYLIEPEDSASGPHILYRPLIADAPLLQFPTRQALLEAIQQPGRLQKDILAWFPGDSTREYYKAWSFKEPTAQTTYLFGVGDGETVPAEPTLAVGGYTAADTLKAKLQAGQLINHLYDANAQGLTSIAEQQSVSDDESRWATLKEGGYLVLNAVLPALRGPGAAIGAVLQFQGILSDLQTLADDDKQNKEPAIVDLLLNLATMLGHFHSRPANPYPGESTVVRQHGLGDAAEINGRLLPSETSPEAPRTQDVRLQSEIWDIKALDGEIQTFIDRYNGEDRINIIGHAAEPEPGQPARVVGDNDRTLSAEDINNELLVRAIDIRKYPNARLIVCYSAREGNRSLAADLSAITGVPVKGYESSVTSEYNKANGADPFEMFAKYRDAMSLKYPNFKKQDIEDLAQMFTSKKLENVYLDLQVRKDTGTPIEANIGTYNQPVFKKIYVEYQPSRFGAPKVPSLMKNGTPRPKLLPKSPQSAPVQHSAKELHNLSEYTAFKQLSATEKRSNSIVFSESRDAQYQYFLDGPENSNERRLNIVGHGDKGGITFQSDLKGAKSYSPEEFAKLIAPLLKETGASSIRLVSCRSGQTGFAEQLSKQLNITVKAPLGTVTQFEVTKDRFWILEKFANPRRPHDHEWKTFLPTPATR